MEYKWNWLTLAGLTGFDILTLTPLKYILEQEKVQFLPSNVLKYIKRRQVISFSSFDSRSFLSIFLVHILKVHTFTASVFDSSASNFYWLPVLHIIIHVQIQPAIFHDPFNWCVTQRRMGYHFGESFFMSSKGIYFLLPLWIVY